GATAAALVDLSTVAGNKISNPPWVKFQSAGWVNFPSAPTSLVIIVGAMSSHPRMTSKLLGDEATQDVFLAVVYELLKRVAGAELLSSTR
ncbi:MAG: hypothetical protein KKG30_09265, partial [Gammaproteobacteria bacterium]|nr:hypothetical protein [Gammaproteobacteria bacterium]